MNRNMPAMFADFSAIAMGSTQKLTSGAASVQSAVFSGNTVIRIVSTTACHIAMGVNPVATAADALMVPNWPEYFAVRGGDKIAVIQDSAAGAVYITEGQIH